MKRIGINLLFLIPGEVGGTEYYAHLLLSELEKKDHEHEFIVFCNLENATSFHFQNRNWKKIICNIHARNRFSRVLYEQLFFPSLVRKYRCTKLHSLGYIGPVFVRCFHILTVHDANWIDCPNDVSIFSRLTQSVLTPAVMLTSDVILTDSKFSKERLLKYFPWVHRKLEIIFPWVSPKFLAQVHKQHHILKPDKTYLLCVSGFYPHKNIPYLLSIIKILYSELGISLVLVGKNGKDQELVLSQVENSGAIRYLPEVKFRDLVNLYLGAKAFIFPSIYEGFGYPVYEALSVGMPVYVGNKNMYDRRIRSYLTELSGNKKKDIALLSHSSSNVLSYNNKNQPEESIKMLKAIYER